MKLTTRGRTVLLALVFAALAVGIWETRNVDSETGKPRTFVIHVEYGAQEDQIACPGTPGRVLNYEPGPEGTADITCATP